MMKDAEQKAEAMAREALQKERDQIEATVKARVDQRTSALANAQAVIDAINEATGMNIMNRFDSDRVLRAIGLMARMEHIGFGGDHSLVEYNLREMVKCSERALEAYSMMFGINREAG